MEDKIYIINHATDEPLYGKENLKCFYLNRVFDRIFQVTHSTMRGKEKDSYEDLAYECRDFIRLMDEEDFAFEYALETGDVVYTYSLEKE